MREKRVGQAKMLCRSLLELRNARFLERMLLRFLPAFNYFLEKILTVSAGPIAFMDERVFGCSYFTIPVDMISPCGSVFNHRPSFQVVRSGVCSSKMACSLPGAALYLVLTGLVLNLFPGPQPPKASGVTVL